MRGSYVRFSPELAAKVCARLAEGHSLSSLGRLPAMPSRNTLMRWRAEHPAFERMYRATLEDRGAATGRRGPNRRPGEALPVPASLPAGRPTSYSPEIAEAVCARVAEGWSMLDLWGDPDLPSGRSLYNWMDRHEDFRRMYLAACELRAERLAEEILAIADDDTGDFIPAGDGPGLAPNLQAIRRARLRIDARKWRVARLAPRKYAAPEAAPVKTHEDWLDELD